MITSQSSLRVSLPFPRNINWPLHPNVEYSSVKSKPLRNIPSVHELLESPPLQNLVERANRNVVVNGVRTFLDNLRQEMQTSADLPIPNPTELAERIVHWIQEDETPSLRPVVNATGILLHTGLGRAPLATEALRAVQEVSRDYASLEVDLTTGQRSQRVAAVTKLLKQLTGAEASVVVNNNAGATLLTLAALAQGKEVIVARGELVEIGGSFRLPEVMEQSGAVLREVGSTNKTRATDYRNAISERTAALLKVHPSNYVVTGFTEEASLDDLITLGRQRHIPVVHDIGSGALLDFAQFGVEGEPLATHSLRQGADVVLFSGDKLLGGPQCGIICGSRVYIDRIASHPLMRALRVDKMTLAALAATLRLYRDPQEAIQAVPLLRLLNTPVDNLRQRAEKLSIQFATLPTIATAKPVDDVSFLGGGSLPNQQLATVCVALVPVSGRVNQAAAELRAADPAVFARVHNEQILLDLRSVSPSEDQKLMEAAHQLTAG
ncbi:MAG: L-seryl-tRNA(Sec) selenium transferase [Planctomycetaceae bacterium]|nr:L-seryl-tRNA(Sec) selenium transferase [Planctomycetaceae bacterium]